MVRQVQQILERKGYSEDYKTGLKGIKNEHHKMVKVKDNHAIDGSMDIDNACKKSNPNDPLWDYLICVKKDHSENLAMIEIHGATGKEVESLIRKKKWVVQWLEKTDLIKFPKAFIWVASGKCAITANSRYPKILAKNGISMPMRETKLLDIDVDYK